MSAIQPRAEITLSAFYRCMIEDTKSLSGTLSSLLLVRWQSKIWSPICLSIPRKSLFFLVRSKTVLCFIGTLWVLPGDTDPECFDHKGLQVVNPQNSHHHHHVLEGLREEEGQLELVKARIEPEWGRGWQGALSNPTQFYLHCLIPSINTMRSSIFTWKGRKGWHRTKNLDSNLSAFTPESHP